MLVVMDRLWETDRPTTKISYNVMYAMAAQGVLCHALGPWEKPPSAQNGAIIHHPFDNGILLYETVAFMQPRLAAAAAAASPLLAKAALSVRHPVRAARIWRHYHLHARAENLRQKYIDAIQAALRENRYDAILGIYFPHFIVEALGLLDLEIPVYLYQLDPWALIEDGRSISPEERLRQETAAFKKAAHIFTTPELLKQYEKHSSFSDFLDKMTALPFPNILPQTRSAAVLPFTYRKDACNLLYAGSLVEKLRDPAFFLSVLEKASAQEPSLHFSFMGNTDSQKLRKFAQEHPNLVTVVPGQSADVALAATQQADILVNIGNVMTNQLPSKVMDYLCSTKPVISTYKHPDCPSVPYFAMYPLGLNLNEHGDAAKAAEILAVFCRQMRGRRLPFNEMETLFHTATPACAAKTILAQMAKNAGEKAQTV